MNNINVDSNNDRSDRLNNMKESSKGKPNSSETDSDNDFDVEAHVDKCLSMVMHNEEIQQISEIVKRIYSQRSKR